MPIPSRARDVFINCPFDSAFAQGFRTLVFSVFACGFRVRCARELDDASETRIEKLYRIIDESRFGIHDLSRTELDPVNKLPRFNMPLELGIFLGAKRFGGKEHGPKRCLVLDIESYRYQKFISDLAGTDIQAHGGDERRMARQVRDWLVSVSRRKTIPPPGAFLKSYDEFMAALPALSLANGVQPDDLSYPDLERLILEWLKLRPPVP